MTSTIDIPQTHSESELLERTRAIVSTLRNRQGETDELSRASDETIAELERAGVFSMMLPHVYGGMQASITSYMQVDAAIGQGDGGVAWAVSLISACNWMAAGLYPRHVSDAVFAEPNTRVAGVFASRGVQAHAVRGGIVVDKGIWYFNSGVYHAQWDLLGVPTFNAAGEAVGRGIALVPMNDVKILNDWDPIGLRGSGSSSVSMEDVFIPSERIVDLAACNEGRLRGGFPDVALYRTAFVPLMVAVLAFPVIGMGAHMLEEFLKRLPGRDIKLTPYTKAGEAAVTHLQIGQASAKISAATALIGNVCSDLDAWAATPQYMPRLQRAAICRDTSIADQLVWEAADILASAGGGSFSRAGNTANRIWRDIKVAGMHPFVTAGTNFENYGRLASGMEALTHV